jgi:predicted nucleic acid-binding protein
MADSVFIDTNVLVYAHDLDAGRKHQVARQLVQVQWSKPVWPCISVQVLQELAVNLLRKGVSLQETRETVRDYTAWRVAENTVPLLEAALDEMARWQVSFWDGLILAAARGAGASVIYSEDLSAGQDYGDIRVENPFA